MYKISKSLGSLTLLEGRERGGGSIVLVSRASIEGKRGVKKDTLTSEVSPAAVVDEDVDGMVGIAALTMSITSGIEVYGKWLCSVNHLMYS